VRVWNQHAAIAIESTEEGMMLGWGDRDGQQKRSMARAGRLNWDFGRATTRSTKARKDRKWAFFCAGAQEKNKIELLDLAYDDSRFFDHRFAFFFSL